MDLTTNFLGFRLRSPIVPSSSPLTDTTDGVKRMEDAGAGAVVLHSLFEEQLLKDRADLETQMSQGTESFGEARTYLPEPNEFRVGPELYLERIRRAKAAVSIPVIASLNGASPGGWTAYARQMQEAGADAIELNVFFVPHDPAIPSLMIEDRYVEIVRQVRAAVSIPLAVKLAPYFTNVTHLAKRLEEAGADALSLFNRFYQPGIDLESLSVRPHINLSTSQAHLVPLHWIGILYKKVDVELAATGGVHQAEDAIKLLMAGANVTMVCSVLLKRGIEEIERILAGIKDWMERNEYTSIKQMIGSVSQAKGEDPAAYERVQYIRSLQNYRL